VRISCTTLESFRLFMNPEQDWMSEDDLLATIRGEFVGNHKVWLGMAFGAVLETPERYRVVGGYRVENPRGCGEDFEFGNDVIDPALASIDREHTVFEAKASGMYAGHQVVAKADQMVGAQLIETKATLSTFDFEKYAESCQWKFMADIFGVPRVTYRVFCLFESEQNGVIELRGVEEFHLYRYAEMRRDLEGLVQDFAAYVDVRGLRGVLEERQLAATGAL
jgi:hypothetical protein